MAKQMKLCKKCKEFKDRQDEFHYINKDRGYKSSYCKPCERTRIRRYMRDKLDLNPRKYLSGRVGGGDGAR